MSRAGYQPLSQSVDDTEDVDVTEERPRHTVRELRRPGRPGHIDLTKLDNAFKRWTESIAHKVKRRKKKTTEHSKREIWRSVFEPTIVGTPADGIVKTLDHKSPMTQAEFDVLVQSIRDNIAEGLHPKMITKGSSGSYFARAKDEIGRVRTVAVFKPKDEEPYGRLNPKTTKWLHRQFRWLIPFGRACLIPNLSYISEAAASLLDSRLKLHIVPPTQLASLSSPAFFYDWIDRTAAKKGKPLPLKVGSLQRFLYQYTDASEFLRKHPWPGRSIADTFDDTSHRRGVFTKKMISGVTAICGGRSGDVDEFYDDYEEERLFDATESMNGPREFYWTPALQRSFREELEKLVILDYLMLNTDRGADNYMIKYCEGEVEKQLIDVAPSRSTREMPPMSELRRNDSPNTTPSMKRNTSTPDNGDYTRQPHIHIAAIDNSLSFPHEHPQGWRSYTYGWLYLPISAIGQPFSQKTRDHFLPLLTSKQWWEETIFQLEKLFAVDPDFNMRMFRRQLAVIKGQALNIVQSLKHDDEGPLELTRRTKMLVWDDEIEISGDDSGLDEVVHDRNEPTSSPKLSISSVPIIPRRTRSQSSSSEFPPPMRRIITESGVIRPVPFSAKFQRVHPGTTGVTVLEHLERLDAVEASLQRLIPDVNVDEVDVGESHNARVQNAPMASSLPPASPFSPPGSPLEPVPEMASLESSVTEEDLVALSKSTSHLEGPPGTSGRHNRWASQALGSGVDWLQENETPVTRTVISERLEMVTKKPLCSCW
ncbi:phosphatidylinositol 3 and 4-kinase-domain-containing protein [Lentinula aciculospora]|uniref:Phosphatidylinositol 4-kinase n=1 Tax=Lentinula aciculospora TaxID=153920 RepID=A0A9W9AIB1_9AGAR|nr:phosphatidylinositol 3 and 4-kinase-domain-containing protein [Lentinula aciculospora]